MIDFARKITDVKTIAERLKHAREAAGLTQGQLAALAKVAQGTIGNIESGARQNPRELLAIAEAVKVDAGWLKTGRGPMRPAATAGQPLVMEPILSAYRAPSLDEALVRIGAELARDMPDFVREDIADEMHRWVQRRGLDHTRQRIAQLLEGATALADGTSGKPR